MERMSHLWNIKSLKGLYQKDERMSFPAFLLRECSGHGCVCVRQLQIIKVALNADCSQNSEVFLSDFCSRFLGLTAFL